MLLPPIYPLSQNLEGHAHAFPTSSPGLATPDRAKFWLADRNEGIHWQRFTTTPLLTSMDYCRWWSTEWSVESRHQLAS